MMRILLVDGGCKMHQSGGVKFDENSVLIKLFADVPIF